MMLNSMVELRKVLPWYGEAAEKAIMWLVRRQREDGSFVEEKGVHVLNKKNEVILLMETQPNDLLRIY